MARSRTSPGYMLDIRRLARARVFNEIDAADYAFELADIGNFWNVVMSDVIEDIRTEQAYMRAVKNRGVAVTPPHASDSIH